MEDNDGRLTVWWQSRPTQMDDFFALVGPDSLKELYPIHFILQP